MLERFSYRHFGTDYVLADAWDFRSSKRPGDERLECVAHFEARGVLAAMAREKPALFDRVHRSIDGNDLSMSRRIARMPTRGDDPRIDRLLQALGLQHDAPGDAAIPSFARLVLLRPAPAARPRSSSARPEGQRIDRLLELLRNETLVLRGEHYQLAHGATSAGVRHREMFETLSEEQLLSVLRDLAADPMTPSARKTYLEELLSLAETQRKKTGHTDILLLRRQRSYARAAEESAPAKTPSQLRQAERHFIAVEVVDTSNKALERVAIQVVLADGKTNAGETNEEGYLRFEPVAAGDAKIRVLKIDGRSWKPVGGAVAVPSGQKTTSQVHVVKQGECLSKLADRFGHSDWQLVWDHADNAELKKKRKNPHVLYPGDKLTIPGLEIYEMVRAVDSTHQIQIKEALRPVELSVVLRDEEDKALADAAYELRWGPEPEPKQTGKLDGSGKLTTEVPFKVSTVELFLPEREERYPLAVSHLDPTEDEQGTYLPSGVGSRLRALGHLTPELKVKDLADLRDALIAFQRLALGQEEPTGELDSGTRGKLEELFGA